jgi:hypothetical protein
MAFIQIKDLRLSLSYTFTENFCSSVGIILLFITSLCPVIIWRLYSVKIKSTNPLPDLNDEMEAEHIRYIYGSLDIDKIKRSVYTKSKHKAFMKRYGALIEDIKLRKLGKNITILTGILPLIRALMISTTVVYLCENPIFSIIVFN